MCIFEHFFFIVRLRGASLGSECFELLSAMFWDLNCNSCRVCDYCFQWKLVKKSATIPSAVQIIVSKEVQKD